MKRVRDWGDHMMICWEKRGYEYATCERRAMDLVRNHLSWRIRVPTSACLMTCVVDGQTICSLRHKHNIE